MVYLDVMARRMTPDQIAEAKEMAKALKEATSTAN
ncbi:MAG: hypothetical protein BWX71_02409 [Deltaproteobacteria bacterium ADurb.Bin072]|nr:MAG: hypothetical protein BWX71_02409 [Deltaproteobacteria bacterium ADurb.Bin072]